MSLHFNYAEVDFVRRAIGGFVIVIAVILMTGWRHTGDRGGIKGLMAWIVTGSLGGWLAGFGGIGGPIPVLYFMAALAKPPCNGPITSSLSAPWFPWFW